MNEDNLHVHRDRNRDSIKFNKIKNKKMNKIYDENKKHPQISRPNRSIQC